MYDSLRTNLPCQVMQFDDLAFTPRASSTSFVTSSEVDVYLQEYARLHGIGNVTKFRCSVDKVSRVGEAWNVTYTDEAASKRVTSSFDAVIVANGHYNEPLIPQHLAEQGKEWCGDIFHSKSYRNPDDFRAKRVLIVGAKSSGTDIAYDLCSGGAEKVFIADRYMSDTSEDLISSNRKHMPDNLEWCKGLSSLVPGTTTVVFDDGNST